MILIVLWDSEDGPCKSWSPQGRLTREGEMRFERIKENLEKQGRGEKHSGEEIRGNTGIERCFMVFSN